jgi:hypothetical protein
MTNPYFVIINFVYPIFWYNADSNKRQKPFGGISGKLASLFV